MSPLSQAQLEGEGDFAERNPEGECWKSNDAFDAAIRARPQPFDLKAQDAAFEGRFAQYDFDILRDVGKAERLFKPSAGTPLMICFARKFYEAKEDYIKGAPI